MQNPSSRPSISRLLLIIVALFGASGVGMGAIGAHFLGPALEKQGVAPEIIKKRVEQVETGVRYQMFHALAMLALVLTDFVRRSKVAPLAMMFMIVGMFLFSGELYLIGIVESKWHMLVPFGGMSYILGWLTLGVSAVTVKNTQS